MSTVEITNQNSDVQNQNNPIPDGRLSYKSSEILAELPCQLMYGRIDKQTDTDIQVTEARHILSPGIFSSLPSIKGLLTVLPQSSVFLPSRKVDILSDLVQT
ncbi:hypothetical protein J6590_028511 [Homalodisca vitripennis]|nr:hypothetical protein J6590_028511 [Homalodisca vitripennis]